MKFFDYLLSQALIPAYGQQLNSQRKT